MKIPNPFKRKKPRTLADMDKMTVGEVEKLLETSSPNIDKILDKKVSLTCPKCGAEVIKISPSVQLGQLYLYECTSCHERCYKH